jgi:hypothetical protein
MRRCSISAGWIGFLACLCGHASAQVPAALAVPAEQRLVLAAAASGVQIYRCRASKSDPARMEWALIAPEADLFDPAGKKIGKHYAGPTWELDDGSKVVGEVTARDKGPDADAIPWLLLKAKETTGTGILGRTQSIQRVATVGGKAPGADCDKAQAGKEIRAPYRATYNFYAAPR